MFIDLRSFSGISLSTIKSLLISLYNHANFVHGPVRTMLISPLIKNGDASCPHGGCIDECWQGISKLCLTGSFGQGSIGSQGHQSTST